LSFHREFHHYRREPPDRPLSKRSRERKIPLISSVYDLRHTFATGAAKDGMPIAVLAATLGHASIRSLMKYVQIDADHIDEAMLQLEQIRFKRGLANQPQFVAGFLPGGVLKPAETSESQ
jgi:integrase